MSRNPRNAWLPPLALGGMAILLSSPVLPQPAAGQNPSRDRQGAVRRGAAPTASASKSAPPSEPASLILGTVAGDRGTTVSIPLYYQPGKNPPLHSLHLEVEFVSNSVKFDKAEKGVAAETQDFNFAIEAKDLPPDAKNITRTRLSIDVSIADPDPKKSLPEGLWAFLSFRIPPEAKPFSITLNPGPISAQDPQKKPVPLAAEAGKIIVSVPDAPLVGCFFFTH